jgi:hypothetical protein
MAHGLREAEIGPAGPRIDSERRSGVGWYVRTSGGPFVASEGRPAHFKRLETSVNRRMRHKSGAIRCHTLHYVALHYM